MHIVILWRERDIYIVLVSMEYAFGRVLNPLGACRIGRIYIYIYIFLKFIYLFFCILKRSVIFVIASDVGESPKQSCQAIKIH